MASLTLIKYAQQHKRIRHTPSRGQPPIRRSNETIAHVLIGIHFNQTQGSNMPNSSKAGSCATNATTTGRQEASNLFPKQEKVNKAYQHIPSTTDM